MIVLGLGFGDEGKGQTVSHLCSKVRNPIVVRFNGGHQAGHTVVDETGRRHVFSNFGSGSLQGAPTYWSRFCTFNPISWMNEYQMLNLANLRFYCHPLAPVVTPYDIQANRELEGTNQHGSCGVGFGTTLAREAANVHFYVQDLKYPWVMRQRLVEVERYYMRRGVINIALARQIETFLSAVIFCQSLIDKMNPRDMGGDFTPIYEGAQGILLDQEFGFFPHVTRSHTTSRNALKLAGLHGSTAKKEEIMYVTRCYATRHGNGPLPNEFRSDLPPLSLVNHEKETNKQNPHQGAFRKTILDLDMIDYATDCDNTYSTGHTKHLMITCADQVPDSFPVIYNGAVTQIRAAVMHVLLKERFKSVTLSYGEKGYEKVF